MCKRDELSYLKDDILEEYLYYSCSELHNEINRLQQVEQTEETRLRLLVLTELLRDAGPDRDVFFED